MEEVKVFSASGPLWTFWNETLIGLSHGPPFVAVFFSKTEPEGEYYNLFTGGQVNNVHFTSPLFKHTVSGFRKFQDQLDQQWMATFKRLISDPRARKGFNNTIYVIDDAFARVIAALKERMRADFDDSHWFLMYETSKGQMSMASDRMCLECPMITFVSVIMCNCFENGLPDTRAIEDTLVLNVPQGDAEADHLTNTIMAWVGPQASK